MAMGLNAHLGQVAWSPRPGNKTEKGIRTFRVSETSKEKQAIIEKQTFFNILLPPLSFISFHYRRLLPKMPFSSPRKPLESFLRNPASAALGFPFPLLFSQSL